MNLRILQILLAILWAFGAFTPKIPLTKSPNFRFSWISLPVIYSAIITILTTLNFYHLQGLGQSNFKLLPRDPLSERLTNAFVHYIWQVSFVSIRIFGMINCGKLVQLIRDIEIFRGWSNSKRTRNFCWKASLFHGIAFSLGLVYWVRQSMYAIISLYGKGELNLLQVIGMVISQFCYEVTFFGSSILILLMSLYLTNAFLNFTSDLERELTTRGEISKCSEIVRIPPEEMSARLARIQGAFRRLNESIGDRIFFLLAINVSISLITLFELIVNVKKGDIWAISIPIYILFFAYLGNGMQIGLEKKMEDLGNILRTVQISRNGNDSVDKIQLSLKYEKVAEDLLSWKWQFSSFNFLPINFRLIPKVVGGLLTYLIFIFQLRLSESNSIIT